jgi:hypothetical protein
MIKSSIHLIWLCDFFFAITSNWVVICAFMGQQFVVYVVVGV